MSFEDTRTYRTMPGFMFKGILISAFLYYKGDSDLVHSWDLIIRGDNLSKMMADERRTLGITDEDMEFLNGYVESYVNGIEGRR